MTDYLYLRVYGENWVAYPTGMRFPPEFKWKYPFRGRGLVSRALYWLNVVGLDKVFLKHGVNPFPACGDDMAYFWPSHKRAIDRYYGFKVHGRKIMAYCKIATSDSAKEKLRNEVDNVKRASEISPRSFSLPLCMQLSEQREGLVAYFTPLPHNAAAVPDNPVLIARILHVAHEIECSGFAHGDFCPHNLCVSADKLWVIDWEEMFSDPPRNLDQISFLSVFGVYGQGKSLEDVLSMLEQRFPIDGIRVAVASMATRKIALGQDLQRLLERDNGE